MDFFPLHEVLGQLTSEPGTTDITFTSRGEVGVRQNMRMAVQTMEPVRLLLSGTVEHFFPNRPQDRRVGQTIMLVDGPRRYRATLTMEEGGRDDCDPASAGRTQSIVPRMVRKDLSRD